MTGTTYRAVTALLTVIVLVAACGTASTSAPPPPTAPPPTATPAAPTIIATPTQVASVAGSPKPTPRPTPKATTAPPPPKPTGVKFVEEDAKCLDGNEDEGCSRYKRTQTVLWKAPRTKGVEIRVFGVTECLARPEHPKPGAHGPCLVKGTNLPSSIRTLLAKAPASAGWVSWSWTEEDEGCNPSDAVGTAPDGRGFDAVVVQAFNATDRSSFAIAEPGGWWEPAEGDMVC